MVDITLPPYSGGSSLEGAIHRLRPSSGFSPQGWERFDLLYRGA